MTAGSENQYPDNPSYHYRRRIHQILETGPTRDAISLVVNYGLIILIVVNVIAFAAETVPRLQATYGPYFDLFNLVSVAIFTIEYVLRVWSSVEIPTLKKQRPLQARLHFAMRPLLIIDLIAILPFYLSFLVPIDLRVLRVLRLFRFFKLARYSPALQTLARVLQAEFRALLGALLVMVSLLLFASTGIYFLERDIQPEAFGSIPAAAWWALATLTTVGYGDVVPITGLGKIFGGMIMVFGLAMFALPIAIIATGFSQEANRRKFVVTWSMVAQVPMFHGLQLGEIAEIATLLQSEIIAPQTIIFRKGETPRGMYFIVHGEVKIDTGEQVITFTRDNFFGERALLEKRVHSADAVALARTNLLILEREDFEYLLRRNPQINQRLKDAQECISLN